MNLFLNKGGCLDGSLNSRLHISSVLSNSFGRLGQRTVRWWHCKAIQTPLFFWHIFVYSLPTKTFLFSSAQVSLIQKPWPPLSLQSGELIDSRRLLPHYILARLFLPGWKIEKTCLGIKRKILLNSLNLKSVFPFIKINI